MFTINMNTDNVAFVGGNFEEDPMMNTYRAEEVARILRKAADTLVNDPERTEGTLMDYNGNKVGNWEFTND